MRRLTRRQLIAVAREGIETRREMAAVEGRRLGGQEPLSQADLRRLSHIGPALPLVFQAIWAAHAEALDAVRASANPTLRQRLESSKKLSALHRELTKCAAALRVALWWCLCSMVAMDLMGWL
jgi:hypothetical protein